MGSKEAGRASGAVDAGAGPAAVDVDKVVTFHLGGQVYALPVDRVQEIQQIVEFAEVPDVSPAILGMVNLRGVVVPAVEMRTLVGLPVIEHTIDTPMIICRLAEGPVAVVVDGVDDVLDLPAGCVQAAPAMHSLASRMIGVCRLDAGMVFLLDIDALLELVELPEPHEEDRQ